MANIETILAGFPAGYGKRKWGLVPGIYTPVGFVLSAENNKASYGEAMLLSDEVFNAIAPMYTCYIDDKTGWPRYRGNFTLRQIWEFLI